MRYIIALFIIAFLGTSFQAQEVRIRQANTDLVIAGDTSLSDSLFQIVQLNAPDQSGARLIRLTHYMDSLELKSFLLRRGDVARRQVIESEPAQEFAFIDSLLSQFFSTSFQSELQSRIIPTLQGEWIMRVGTNEGTVTVTDANITQTPGPRSGTIKVETRETFTLVGFFNRDVLMKYAQRGDREGYLGELNGNRLLMYRQNQ